MHHFLVLNSGSQSEKVALFKTDGSGQLDCVYRGEKKIESGANREAALQSLLDESPVSKEQIDAVGHRIVHGGTEFSESVIADGKTLQKLTALNKLAPLHNPPAIAGVEASQKIFKDTAQVLVFDTSFHKTLDEAHYLYPLPAEWKKYGIRKFGFHGISHQYSLEQASCLLKKTPETINMISCHLGGGASVCAIENGKSIDISMGFSPLDGVMMGTRSGAIDAAIIPYLMAQKVELKDIEEMLNKRAGLLGVSELSSDMQEIHKAIANGNAKAILAHKMYCLSISKAIGAMSANFSRLDAISFTGGIGFNDSTTRAAILPPGNLHQSFLTEVGEGDCVISTADSRYSLLKIKANEELMIARECERLLSSAQRAQ